MEHLPHGTERVREKRYNMQGQIARLKQGTARNGATWCQFSLLRRGRRAPVRVVAFGEQADNLLDSYIEGDYVRIFGFYDRSSYTGGDGRERHSARIRLLWSGDPRGKMYQQEHDDDVPVDVENDEE